MQIMQINKRVHTVTGSYTLHRLLPVDFCSFLVDISICFFVTPFYIFSLCAFRLKIQCSIYIIILSRGYLVTHYIINMQFEILKYTKPKKKEKIFIIKMKKLVMIFCRKSLISQCVSFKVQYMYMYCILYSFNCVVYKVYCIHVMTFSLCFIFIFFLNVVSICYI